MTECILQFELEDQADSHAVAEALQSGLLNIDTVSEAEAEPTETRFGVVETVSLITAGVVLLREAKTGVDAVTELLDSIKALIEKVGEVKEAYLEVRGRKVPISEVTAEDIKELA